MYQKRTNKETKESAVSPVVGVMLMLVVTIVIAAVVTVFATGLVGTQEKAPTISLEASIANGGNYYDSYFDLNVISVSEAIPTSDLTLVTTWYNKTSGTYQVTKTGDIAVNWVWKEDDPSNGTISTLSPWGYGTGVSKMNTGVPTKDEQEFGVYTLLGGTLMHAYPAGQNGGFVAKDSKSTDGYFNGAYTSRFSSSGDDETDGMQSILGYGWETLKAGDIVNVKLLHNPSNSYIFEKDVVVS